jgi:hypothetical protein
MACRFDHLLKRNKYSAKRLAITLERVKRVYGTARFIIQVALMDMEFEKLKDILPDITTYTTAAREHERKKNTGNQGENQRDNKNPPLPYAAKAHDNQADIFLCHVDELVPR